MKRVLFTAILALLATSWGCVGYHRGYESSYSPGCDSCGHAREHREEHEHHGGHGGGGHHGGHHDGGHHDRDDHHHHRRH
jgi:hypothetical protein